MGHANLILHGAGWMEGGLVASFEKLVVDVEIIQSMAEFLQPLWSMRTRSASRR